MVKFPPKFAVTAITVLMEMFHVVPIMECICLKVCSHVEECP